MSSAVLIRWMRSAVVMALLATPAMAEYKVVHEPAATDPMGVTIYELDNGLTVYLTENHQQPRFYAEIVVRAGSKHDPAETTGLAHYLEHLLFKGTGKIGTLDYAQEKPSLDRITQLYEEHFREPDAEKRKAIYAQINEESKTAAAFAIPNEFDRLYKAMGASDVNAHTSNEETVYKVELPVNRLKQWALVEAERFSDPIYRLFQPELEIVYEEKNRSMDNKDRIIGEAVAQTLYKKHPYGQQTTLGSVEHLKKPSLVNIDNFFRTYYVPNNMAICISGDIKKDETIRIIDEQFSSWKPKKLPKQKKWREAPLQGAERVTVKYPGEQYVLLAFRTAGQNHREADTLRLLDMVLSNSVAGLIDLNLVQRQVVRGAGSYPIMNNDYGAQYLFGIPKEGQTLAEVERLLLDQVETIKRGEVEDWVIPAIITDFKKMRKGGFEDDQSRVAYMREAYVAFQDWDYAAGQIERMEKLTKKDVIRAANKYFGENYVAGYREDGQHEVPKIEKPAIDKVEIDPRRQSAFATDLLAMNVPPLEPVFLDPAKDYSITSDPNGIPFYYVKNPVNDLFALTITMDVGTEHDNRLQVAAQLLDKSGTKSYSADALKKEWYKLGTSFSFGTGDSESSVSIAGLDENLDASLALMADVMKNPAADEATLEQLKQIILARREDAKKDPSTLASAVVQYNRFGAESSFLRMVPTETLKALTVDDLQALTRGLLNYKHAVLYVGSLPQDKVIALVQKHFPASQALQEPPPYKHRQLRAPATTEIYFFNKETAQAQVQIDFGGELYAEDRIPASILFNTYFAGGMAGVVFQELREARALAYAVGARYVTGSRKGDYNYMVGGMGTQSDKTPEAVEGFVQLLDAMPVADERFGIAKESLINSFTSTRLGFRDILGSVRSWERLGIPVDPRRARYERARSAQLALMMDFYQSQIVNRPKLISVVGDKSKIDMNRLAAIGKVVEVTVDDIFVK